MSEAKHILIVEDEVIIAMDIKQCLEEFGYMVDEVADSADEAMFCVKKYSPDLVLMDIKLKGQTDGTQIVDEIQTKHNIPVVYLTSHSDVETLNLAQETKPYGYIIKPADEKQLNSTIVIALKRFEEENKWSANEEKNIKINKKYKYSLNKRQLFCQDKEISFTKKEGEFVHLLVKNLDTSVPSEYIIKELWDDKVVPLSTLRSLVRRVRDKIEDDLIESAVAVGYRLKSKLN